MKAAAQLIVIIARLWPLLAVAAVLTPAGQNSPRQKTFDQKSKQFLRDLVQRACPLASK
jgi:hypothetical protein